MKVSAGERKAFIGVVDTYTENKPVHSLITDHVFAGANDLNVWIVQ